MLVGNYDVEYRELSKTSKLVRGRVEVRHQDDDTVSIINNKPNGSREWINIPKSAYEEMLRMEKKWGG